MGGISGIIQLNGGIIKNEELELMKEKLIHRGIDGHGFFYTEKAALLNLSLHVSPESISEKQPYTKDNCTITADARIDNRQELIEKLEINPSYSDSISDSEIILAAYNFWGEDCLFHLIGDFAFAIWDENKNQLFCGRDHMGVRPFYYYYKKGEIFAFASEIKALLALDFVPKTLNKEKIAIYLCWLSDNSKYKESTFFENIVTLKPANSLKVNKEKIESKFCWDFNLERFSLLKTEEDFVKTFKEYFIEAVRCRIRTNFGVAAHLSGGLDSSSIVGVANKLSQNPMTTLHDVTGYPSTDEQEYAVAVLEHKNLKHHWVKPKEDFWESLTQISEIFDRPEHFNIASQRQLAQAEIVKTSQSRVLLTGHDGDTVVTYGTTYLTHLLENQNWEKFKDLFEKYVLNKDVSYNIPDWENFDIEVKKKYLVESYLNSLFQLYLFNGNIKKIFALTKFSQGTYHYSFCNYFLLKVRRVLKRFFYLFKNDKFLFHNSFFNYIKINNLVNKNKTKRFEGLDNEENSRLANIYSAGMIDINEQFNHIGEHYNFLCVHPFLDKRLIELCLVIPAEYNFGDGKLRNVLREAMKDYLPEIVYKRTSKVDLSDYVYQVFTKEIDYLNYCSLNENSTIIDFNKTKHLYKKMVNETMLEEKYRMFWKFCRVPYLTKWINRLKINYILNQ